MLPAIIQHLGGRVVTNQQYRHMQSIIMKLTFWVTCNGDGVFVSCSFTSGFLIVSAFKYIAHGVNCQSFFFFASGASKFVVKSARTVLTSYQK